MIYQGIYTISRVIARRLDYVALWHCVTVSKALLGQNYSSAELPHMMELT